MILRASKASQTHLELHPALPKKWPSRIERVMRPSMRIQNELKPASEPSRSFAPGKLPGLTMSVA